ncbi:MAG: PstS family phosphate ABC transporter substrate-binding protein [Opitutales bacterium]
MKTNCLFRLAARLGLALALWPALRAQEAAAPLPEYRPGQVVTGTLRSWGNPQMAGLMKNWEAGFRRYHPDLRFEDSLKGTASAQFGLAEWVADLAVMGRQVYTYEFYGTYRRSLLLPVEIAVAGGSFDVPHKTYALAVFVHKDNPLAKLTLRQLDGIFGAQRTGGWQGMKWNRDIARGPEGNLRTWGQLGLTGEWANRPIHPYGPPGVYPGGTSFFQSRVMGGADTWAEDLREYVDRQAMIEALAKDPCGIAYTGFCYATPGVKTLALAEKEGSPSVAPTRATVADRSYPLSRLVYIYFTVDRPNGDPADPRVDPKVREFLTYILSRQGQADVAREGDYLPLTAGVLREQLKKLE